MSSTSPRKCPSQFFCFWCRLKSKSHYYFQVDYIEDDGWDFCSALWQLNLQGNQVCHNFQNYQSLHCPEIPCMASINISMSFVIFVPSSSRLWRGTSSAGFQVSPTSISGEQDCTDCHNDNDLWFIIVSSSNNITGTTRLVTLMLPTPLRR